MRGLALALLLPLPVTAQEVDCASATSTPEMAYCATLNLEGADAALNEAYASAMGTARAHGAEQEGLLRDAQRLWLGFRDAACEAEAALHQGGTAQPMMGTLCLARLSRARADDLWAFARSLP